jgi:integrase/recombinase XerD
MRKARFKKKSFFSDEIFDFVALRIKILMHFIKTQKMLYNHEIRIRFISESDDAEYISLLRKLPDCRWSGQLNSWHTRNIKDHIRFLNRVFPGSVRFYDISKPDRMPKVDELISEKKIKIETDRSSKNILLYFLYDNDLSEIIKKMGGCYLGQEKKAWSVPDLARNRQRLNSFLQKANYSVEFIKDKTPFFNGFQEESEFRKLLFKLNYSERSVEQYVYNLRRFLEWKERSGADSRNEINEYLNEMSIKSDLSRSYQNQFISAVKLFYKHIKGVELRNYEFCRPKLTRALPPVLTPKETGKIIKMIPNLKHNALISVVSNTGITAGEVTMLRPGDIDWENRILCIKGTDEGFKRKIPLPPAITEKLRSYMECYAPANFVFEGPGGQKYTVRSVQKVLKKYVSKAGIEKKTSLQTLRHSYGAELIRNGSDLNAVMELMGYKSRRTAEIYNLITAS